MNKCDNWILQRKYAKFCVTCPDMCGFLMDLVLCVPIYAVYDCSDNTGW